MSRVVLFDDAFFCLGNSGIGKMWSRVFASPALKSACEDSDLELLVLNRSDALVDRGFRCIDFPEYDGVHPAADRNLIGMIAEECDASLFVSSYYTFAPNVRSMMPAYDLIPEVFGFHASERGWLERQLALVHASGYFAISENTARDLQRFYPFISADQIYWAHLGVDTTLFYPRSANERDAFLRHHGLKNFMVMVGSRYQTAGYKNGSLLLAAMSQPEMPSLDVVFIGGEQVTEHERRVCAEAGVKVLRLEPDDDELALCLSAAEVLVFPSLYEGFGLPPLEALASGTPVVVTNASSLPEVVGHYGLFIDGHDPAVLSSQIARSLSDTWRSLILRDGPRWSARFSWDSVATAFVEACVATLNRAPQSSEGLVDAFLDEYTDLVENWQR